MSIFSRAREVLWIVPQFIMWEKTHIVASARFSSWMKAKGKTHACFPNRRLFRSALALQAASATPILTFIIWGCKCVLCPNGSGNSKLAIELLNALSEKLWDRYYRMQLGTNQVRWMAFTLSNMEALSGQCGRCHALEWFPFVDICLYRPARRHWITRRG